MFKINRLHHVSLIVSDIDKALAFYCGLLGLSRAEGRPALSFSGAWLDLGSGQQMHLLELDNPDSAAERPEHGGRDRHTAFHIESLDSLVKILNDNEINYTMSKSSRTALFCRDPDGNALEFFE